MNRNTNRCEKSYLKHLFSIASADGHLDDTEMEYIVSIGKRLNFTEEEIAEIKHDRRERSSSRLPAYQDGRFFMLFSLINLILADNEVHPEEVRITENIVMQLGYDPGTVDTILETIRYNKDNGISPDATYEHLRKYLA